MLYEGWREGGRERERGREGGREAWTYAGFVGAAFEDELLGRVMPVLDRRVRGRQTRRPQGQTGLSMPIFIPFLGG